MQVFQFHDAISVLCSDGSSCMCGSCSQLNLPATLGVGEDVIISIHYHLPHVLYMRDGYVCLSEANFSIWGC